MKKLLTALLVAAMVLSLAGAAFAADFSDTADLNKDAQADIAKLNALNIINGYEDGTFKPEKTITRAEFAKIAVILAGMEKSADVLANSPSQFGDVKTGVWYTGWVNLAASQGYVKGYPDGTFRPNSEISNAAVVTVLLRVVGYNDNLPGPWPVDYIAKAGAEDITGNVSFDANGAATRSDVAVMSAATLDADVVKWDADDEDFVDKNDDETALLDENFDGAVNEDYIVTDWKMDKDTFKVELKAWDGGDEDDQAIGNGWYELADSATIAGINVVPFLTNHMADVIYDDDEEEIIFIDVTSSYVAADEGDFSYDEDNDEFEIDDVEYDAVDADEYYEGVDLDDLENPVVGYYRAYLTDDDEVYTVVKRPETAPGLVDEYKTSTERITYKENGSSEDFTDEDVLVVKNGAYAELTDIDENDVVYTTEDKGSADFYLEVYSIDASGEFQAAYNDEATLKVEGTKYDVANGFKMSRDNGDDFESIDLDDIYNTDVKYFLNKANKVAYMITDADGSGDDSNTVYGVVTDIVAKNSINNKVTEIKVMKNDGSEVNYDIDTDEVELTYGDDDGDQLDIDDFIKVKINDNNEIDSLTFLAKVVNGVVVAPTATNCHLASGDVDDYIDADENAEYILSVTDADSDNDRIKVGGTWYYMDEDTVAFNGYLNDDDDDDEASIEKNGDIIDWAEDLNSGVVAYVQYDGNDIEYIYVSSDVSASEADYAVVLDTYKYDGDKWVAVDINGNSESYELKGSSYPIEGAVYDYSISSNKFDAKTLVFNPEVEGDYKTVTDVDADRDAVEVADVWYFTDEDTVIYDFSDWYDDDDDAVYVDSLSDINEDDFVIVELSDDASDAAKNIVKTIWIVNDIDTYEFDGNNDDDNTASVTVVANKVQDDIAFLNLDQYSLAITVNGDEIATLEFTTDQGAPEPASASVVDGAVNIDEFYTDKDATILEITAKDAAGNAVELETSVFQLN